MRGVRLSMVRWRLSATSVAVASATAALTAAASGEGTSEAKKEASDATNASVRFKQDLKARWSQANEEIGVKSSRETRLFCESGRESSFSRKFHRPLEASMAWSSLDKYRFGGDFTMEEKWRHRIYSYGLMKILHNEYNGNKCGPTGSYPHREGQRNVANNLYKGSPSHDIDYKGHNIAALAVNEFGEVVTSAFNHNKVFGSTAEHAEMRLMDECFRSPALHFERSKVSREAVEKFEVEDKMKELTVYTSLEPCQQCSGRLLLAGVPEVVYLQQDPDIMLQALGTYKKDFKTRPVPAVLFDFDAYDDFADKYWALKRKAAQAGGFGHLEKFWNPPPGSGMRAKSFGQSMPYFLCTDDAKATIDKASGDFEKLFTDRDEHFSKLCQEEKDRVLNFKPPANAARRRNVENELWQRRVDLLVFEHEQRKEIRIQSLNLQWKEQQLAEAIASVDGVADVETINVMRWAGGRGKSRGEAYLQFATAKAAEDAGIALCQQGFAAQPALNYPKLRKLLDDISRLEKGLETLRQENGKDGSVLSNKEALEKLREYVEYERKCERRGTMHR